LHVHHKMFMHFTELEAEKYKKTKNFKSYFLLFSL